MTLSWADQLETLLTATSGVSELQPHQKPPEGDWRGWVLLAGRGAGKTYAGMRWLDDRCQAEPGLRARVIAPTFADGVASCVEGPNGLLEASGHLATWRPSEAGGACVHYPNGSRVWIIGTPGPRDVDRLRALTNIEVDIFEEAFANPKLADAWLQARLSRRRGNPRVVVTSTPRPHPLLKEWAEDPSFTITRAITRDNAHLDPDWVAELEKSYKGTRLYRQEVLGEILEDVEGALWTIGDLDRSRVPAVDDPVETYGLIKIVIGVDPAATVGTTGIVVAGCNRNHQIYVLGDYSRSEANPNEWARAVATATADWRSSGLEPLVVAEINQGGKMVSETLRAADRTISVTTVHAAKGKQARAEPVALLWEAEEQQAHIVGRLPTLEDELTRWIPGTYSSDQTDALVWAVTYLRRNAGHVGRMVNPARSGYTIPKRGSVRMTR